MAATPDQARFAVSPWTPRPPRPDEPASWSWPLPPADWTREAEINKLMTGHDPLSRGAADLVIGGWPAYQLTEWHAERCAAYGHRDHHTGLIRGHLCRGCNIREGRNSSDVLALYGQMPPAAILNVEMWYVGRGWPIGWWQEPALAYRLTGNPRWLTDAQRAALADRGDDSTAVGLLG